AVHLCELTAIFFKSLRQIVRTLLDALVLSPNLFSVIISFRRASVLLDNTKLSLADIAAVMRYSDQSHFTHEFVRYHVLPPSRARQDAAFLQDQQQMTRHNTGSSYIY